MSKNSEHVKTWRKNFKQRMIDSMGGKCCCCGYNKCNASLALHHLDPLKKDFGFGSVMSNPQKWMNIVEELRKCILVCHNCHSEIHAGFTKVPQDAPVFDESFANYKEKYGTDSSSKSELEIKIIDSMDKCPMCGTLKPKFQKNCSYQCSARSRFKVEWDKINLEEELKTQSIVDLAEKIGCSDGAIHKRLRKIGFDRTKLIYNTGRKTFKT